MNKHNVQEIINSKGYYIATPVGISMQPLLRNRLDTAYLVKINRPLKKYDVILYQRITGKYVLHRILKVRKSDYVICGDNQSHKETGITDKEIIAVMKGYYRGEKFHSCNAFNYKLYCRYIVLTRPIRLIRDLIKKIFHKIFRNTNNH